MPRSQSSSDACSDVRQGNDELVGASISEPFVAAGEKALVDGSTSMGESEPTTTTGDDSASEIESKEGPDTQQRGKKRKKAERRRQARNQSQKERANRITRQINDLKELLSKNGFIADYATKETVLAQAASFIRTLQQQEADHSICPQQSSSNVSKGDALEFSATVATVPEVASLMNQLKSTIQSSRPFASNVPQQQAATCQVSATVATRTESRQAPKECTSEIAASGSASKGETTASPTTGTVSNPPGTVSATTTHTDKADLQVAPTALAKAVRDLATSASLTYQRTPTDKDYKGLFEVSPVPMAIASLGGRILDSNNHFRAVAGRTKEELGSMTFFNLTHQQDLAKAFSFLAKMITSPLLALGLTPGDVNESTDTFTVKAIPMLGVSSKGLRVDAMKNEQGTLRCLCVSLIDMGVSE